jgi:hypothetical protein
MRVVVRAFAGIGEGLICSADRRGGCNGRLTAALPLRGKALKHLGWLLFLVLSGVSAIAQGLQAGEVSSAKDVSQPPGVVQARRFLAQRGWRAGQTVRARRFSSGLAIASSQSTAATATWEPLGPKSVLTPKYGLVSGRITSVAFDPADATGNRVYVGTLGGGVWLSQNAATSDPGNVVFSPLTDTIAAMSNAQDASISIGALTVQPGGTGVVLAGTGDPNDALDSYYGAGILRSLDGGQTWTVVQHTIDQKWAFVGEGIAGFAWSTLNPQLVVVAVSQAWEGVVVAAPWPHLSYQGLYYSTDSGATWSLARIADLNGWDVQGPQDAYAGPDGNAATSVVWNQMRGLFIAAVRFHGYYQSGDGVTWTRLASQPGSGLTTQQCPTNATQLGSTACPIYRGTLAVNPRTGDTFAWTVDLFNQDQGIWQDACAATGGACPNPLTFAKQWKTSVNDLQTNTALGSATIQNGDYSLALAAVPSDQDTILLAGANDLWKCSLAMGCLWRNTTNTDSCKSAQVASFQHTLAWNDPNPLEFFVGNDSGLWRSTDGIGETGAECVSDNADHFQNLNGSLGSLADVASLSPVGNSPYTMMVGLGVNGTAGVKSTTGPTANWEQILDGEGGPVAIDPTDPTRWYVNNGAGVSIHLCAQPGDCTPAAFGVSPVISQADVGNDGLTMITPAPFIVDPLDPVQLLIGTCRVWRGPANGIGWTQANAISPVFDGKGSSSPCSGNALIRSMAAIALPGGGEKIYVGMSGVLNGGATLPGHVLSATMNASGGWSTWQDLSLNPVTNDKMAMNILGFDISSLTIDPIDTAGSTVVATVAGYPNSTQIVRGIYRSTDGGSHWAIIVSNLPFTPANAFALDPKDPETAYLGTDRGVFSTQRLSHCADNASNCWSGFGAGLPGAPVVALSAAPISGSLNVLAAATYGRGVWQVPLLTAGIQMTTVTVDTSSLTFGALPQGTMSSSQTVTLTNTGSITLLPTAADASGDFSKTDNCVGLSIHAGASCTIQVSFTPSQTGYRAGQLTIRANVANVQLTVPLSGTGTPAGLVTLSPASIDFGGVPVGNTSAPLQVTAENSGAVAVSISGISVSGPFVVSANACGSSLAAKASCQITVNFKPATPGMGTGVLTVVDQEGTHTVQLFGNGDAPATDTLSPTSVSFPATIINALSMPQTVTLANTGDVPLTSIKVSVNAPFQVSTNCTTQLTGQSSCAINVVFKPTVAGTQTGTLTVADLIKAQTVPLTGIGLLPPLISVSPVSLTFAVQQVLAANAPLTLTVTNSGGAPMANVGFGITGQTATSFSTGTTNCGASLANGSSCTVQVIFKPTASGLVRDSLIVSSSTLGVAAATVPLSGTGKSQSGLNTSPAELIFAAQASGVASAPQTVTIVDTGGTNAGGLAIAVSEPFSLTQNTCATSLAAGASCTTGVVFTPTLVGMLAGALTASSTRVTAATVALSGTGGLTGAVAFQPALAGFPTTGVGTTSSQVTVTVTNSSATVALTNMVLMASSGFTLASNTCGATLATGASCTVGVAFAPTAAGAQTGSVSLTSSALTATASVALSEVGFDFTASALGSASKTVASGQTATYTLNLVPSAGGGVATFTFQCGTLPLYAACVFNPASESIAADTTGTESVQVTTTQNKAMMVRPSSPGQWLTWPLTCGLLMIPLAFKKRRGMLLLILLLGLVVCGASSYSSSGGGSGGNTPPPSPTASNTPAGTYSIPVTITSYGVQHVVTLTLVVD